MYYLKIKKRKELLIGLIVFLILFQASKFIIVRVFNLDLPRGKVVFCSILRGNSEIFLMDTDGTNLRLLTKYSFFGSTFDTLIIDSNPSFSFDGKRIIFESDRDDASSSKINILDYKKNIIGWKLRPKRDELYVMTADGKVQTRLTHSSAGGNSPFFSFDDKSVLFYSHYSGGGPFHEELKIISLDNSNETVLSKGLNISRLARFSCDSQKVLFVSRGDLYIQDINSGSLTRLTHFNIRDIDWPNKMDNLVYVDNFVVSPDNAKIIFVTTARGSLEYSFYSINTDGTDLRPVANLNKPDSHRYLGYIAEMKYSPDGKTIAFIGHFDDKPFYMLDRNNNLVFVRNLCDRKGNIKDIEDDHFVFTPDGKNIMFVADFSMSLFSDTFIWLKSLVYEKFTTLKYLITKRVSGTYDNKYLCSMDIATGKIRRVCRLLIGSSIGRDFIHWEK